MKYILGIIFIVAANNLCYSQSSVLYIFDTAGIKKWYPITRNDAVNIRDSINQFEDIKDNSINDSLMAISSRLVKKDTMPYYFNSWREMALIGYLLKDDAENIYQPKSDMHYYVTGGRLDTTMNAFAGFVGANFRTIPTSYSKLQSDDTFARKSQLPDLSDYAFRAEVPTKTSDLINDDSFTTVSQINYGMTILSASLSANLTSQLSDKISYGDTMSMLSPYLRKAAATLLYQPIGSYLVSVPTIYMLKSDTASINNRINLKQDALGFTPYNATNPSNYISSETDPQFDTKFGLKTTANLSEGSNLYWTTARGDARYPLLSGSYSNPSWIGSLAQSKVTYTGTSLQYINGSGSYITFPTIPTNNNQLTNGNAFIGLSALSASTGINYDNATGIITNTLPDTYSVKIWSKSIQLSAAGILVVDTFSINSSTPTVTLNLPTGTTIAKVMSAVGYRSGGTVSNSPQVSISAMTSTTVSLVVYQQNTAVTTILGISVLSGTPIILVPDPANIKVLISYICY